MRRFQPHGPIISVGIAALTPGFTGIDLVWSIWGGKVLERIVGKIGERRLDFAAPYLRLPTLVK